jgi:mRNA interferase MazF
LERLNRGEVVTVAIQGDLGKPRPALVIQADVFSETATITVLPITGELTDAPLLRIGLSPSDRNGLRKPSQIMIDKPITIKREKVGQRIGALESADMIQVDRSIALFLGIAA